MRIARRARHHNAIPTASMADIAMLLLIFFLSTTIFKPRDALSVRLPGTYSGDRLRKEQTIRVWLGPGGEVSFNDSLVPPDRVGDLLAVKLAQNPNLMIALYADARVPYALVARIIDQMQNARAPRVTFTTERRETR